MLASLYWLNYAGCLFEKSLNFLKEKERKIEEKKKKNNWCTYRHYDISTFSGFLQIVQTSSGQHLIATSSASSSVTPVISASSTVGR